MSRRKRHDLFANSHKILRFACKDYGTVFVISEIERPDTDRIARGNPFIRSAVVYYAGKLRVKTREHISSVFKIHRQYYFAVAVAFEFIPFFHKLLLLLCKAV